MNEEWRDVVGYEGLYQVSNIGRIKSLDRQVWNGKTYYHKKGRILKRTKTTTGYWKVELYNSKGIKRSRKAHRLVAFAFIPNPLKKPHINHIDGNPLNNVVSNLEWCTQQENVIHAIETGLKKTFSLPFKDLHELYTIAGLGTKRIGKIYNVSHEPISRLLDTYNIDKKHTGRQYKYNIKPEMIMKVINGEMKNVDLAKELNCNPSLISIYKRKYKEMIL